MLFDNPIMKEFEELIKLQKLAELQNLKYPKPMENLPPFGEYPDVKFYYTNSLKLSDFDNTPPRLYFIIN